MEATMDNALVCPYCHTPTRTPAGLSCEERTRLSFWLESRCVPLLTGMVDLRVCTGCNRLYETPLWGKLTAKLGSQLAPCPTCSSRAAFAPFVEREMQLSARRRFPELAHRSLCLYCDANTANGVAPRCNHCPVEPKLYLCTRCGAVAKWSESANHEYRLFETVD